MAARLLLIRHGESTLGSQGRYAGHFDTPLTPRGRRQVIELRRRFRRYSIDRIYSSDLERCRTTAQLLASDQEIVYTKRLRELSFGEWEGRHSDEIAGTSRYIRWMRDPADKRPPRGESLAHLLQRITRFVNDVTRHAQGRTIALITHGGPIRLLLVSDLTQFWSVDVPCTSLKIVDWPHGRRNGR